MADEVREKHLLVDLWAPTIAGGRIEPPDLKDFDAGPQDVLGLPKHRLGADLNDLAEGEGIVVVEHHEVVGPENVAAVDGTVDAG